VISVGRSFIRGPRFTFQKRSMCCDKCVFGNGEHAEWCEKREKQEAFEVFGSRAAWKHPAELVKE
jgi:hypothetical protein